MTPKSKYFTQLAAYEISLIRAAIPFAKTTTELAERLGMNRTTLIEKSKILGIFGELSRHKGKQ